MAKTWADVKKGDVVELAGGEWTVEKIKAGKKKADVRVAGPKGRRAESTVKLADRVKIVGKAPKRPALDGPSGEQTRWATKREHDEAMSAPGIGRGDAAQTTPPAKAKGSPWDTQGDRVEAMLGTLLEARLVGETTDEDKGYYVPPVDETTVASHLAIFHGGIPAAVADDELRMIYAHDAQHAAALKGEAPLAVNHWHTEKRPS